VNSVAAGEAAWTIALWVCGLATALLLILWTRYLHAGYLAGAGIMFAPATALFIRAARPSAASPEAGNRPRMVPAIRNALRGGFVLLLVALLVGIAAHFRFEVIEYRWPELEAQRERDVARTIATRMEEIEARAKRASAQASVIGRTDSSDTQKLVQLDSVQRRNGVDAIAILSNTGDLVAWAGSHRGPIPDLLRTQTPPVYFAERALFSYLYFTAPIPGTPRHVLTAVLIETGFTGEMQSSGFASSFRDQIDAEVTFHAGHPGIGGNAIWSLVSNGDTIVHARAIPVPQADRRREAEVAPRIIVLLLALLGFVFLGAAWIRMAQAHGSRRGFGIPLLFAIPLLAIAPVGEALGVRGGISKMLLLLPGSDHDVTITALLAVLMPVAALVASMRRRAFAARPHRIAVIAGAVITSVAFAACTYILITSATAGLLESDEALWFGLQVTGTILMAVIAAMSMPRLKTTSLRAAHFKSRALLIAGAVLSLGLGAYVASSFDPMTPVRFRLALLWALPFACFAFALATPGGRYGGISRWLAAGWLASTALVPQVWNAHLNARLDSANRDLATLGTNPDPFIDYLLESFGREAVYRFDAGEDSVPLLYGTWVAKLASQSYSAEVMLWSPQTKQTVQLGSPTEVHEPQEDSLIMQLVDSARASGVQQLYTFVDKPHIAHMLTVPLGNGEVISVVVPPRRTLDRRFGVAFFLGGVLPARTRLDLVEAKAPPATEAQTVTWHRTAPGRCVGDVCPDGWRSETIVQYPDGPYHARLTVAIAPLRVRVARAMLIVAFDMFVLLALWVAGTAARGMAPIPVENWKQWSRSFRSRITLALFAFFLIPTIAFGYVAYRALAQEVERATQLVAERAAEQAAAEFPDQSASLVEMSQHTDTDVLRYHGGELFEVSSPEALELGVYGAWMPARVYRSIASREETSVVDVEQLGSQRLLTAYHALRASGTLAVPMPLISTDTSERQRELAHEILFAALIGALLSVALAIVVGQALAGPIGRLTRASTAVGAGRLGVRLPEKAPGEFGQLYESFNQMVRRLRRARSRELRTARVLAWGEMARQVAHEIKNPLTPIKLAVQHMRRAYNDRHPDFPQILESNVSQILHEIDHLSEISRAFSRYGAPAQAAGPLQPVEVSQIVREAMTLYRTGDDRLLYREEVDAGLPPVLARPGELKEVLFNLIENARAAITEHGTITVNARVADGQVYVEVVDTGIGIPDEMLPRIFDPHFSTRSSGTGLGLAIVRRLVESWGGTVEAESSPGAGTKVCVRLLPAELFTG
jgi:signal transduction histidine kinase